MKKKIILSILISNSILTIMLVFAISSYLSSQTFILLFPIFACVVFLAIQVLQIVGIIQDKEETHRLLGG